MWENWHPLAAAQGWLSRSSLAKVTPAGCALPRRSSCEGLADSRSSRIRMLRTWLAIHNLCPRAVGMPRAVSAPAMAYGPTIPLARISAITGARAIARASACAMHTRRAASRACGVATALIAISSPLPPRDSQPNGSPDGCAMSNLRGLRNKILGSLVEHWGG